MRYLLDTHVLLWWLSDARALGKSARSAIDDPANEILVSAVTAWEIAIKRAVGKLDSPADLEEQILSSHFTPLPITVGHALAAGALPRHHEDPFDRILVAQAMAERLTVVTRDPRIALYGITTFAA